MNNRKVKKLIKKLRKIERTKGPSSRKFRRTLVALNKEYGYSCTRDRRWSRPPRTRRVPIPTNQNGTQVNHTGRNPFTENYPKTDEEA